MSTLASLTPIKYTNTINNLKLLKPSNTSLNENIHDEDISLNKNIHDKNISLNKNIHDKNIPLNKKMKIYN